MTFKPMKKVLSIIIPAYNMEGYLNRCVSSLIVGESLLKSLDIIIVNDGSKDSTLQIAERWHSKYPYSISVIDKPNGHYGSCINKGLSVATGKYVKVLDADDWFNTQDFENYISFLIEVDSDLVLTDSFSSDSEGLHEYHKINLPPKTTLEVVSLLQVNLDSLPHQSLTYRKELLSTISYRQSEGIPYTDIEWDLYPMSGVSSVCFFPSAIYVYDMARDGQSVNGSIHCRDMKYDRQIVMKAVKFFERRKGEVPEENRDVMLRILSSNVQRIYFHYLINFPNFLPNEDIVSFDIMLKENSLEIYESVTTAKEYRKFMSFSYIKEWRKKQSRRTLLFFIFDVGVFAGYIRRLILRMK